MHMNYLPKFARQLPTLQSVDSFSNPRPAPSPPSPEGSEPDEWVAAIGMRALAQEYHEEATRTNTRLLALVREGLEAELAHDLLTATEEMDRLSEELLARAEAALEVQSHQS